MDLSIIIPAYNEETTVVGIINKVFNVDFRDIKFEVIFVNDGSIDGTLKAVEKLGHPVKILEHDTVRGKSAAVRTALKEATGKYVITQDADLELDPKDIIKLYAYANGYDVSVVYGSRRLKKEQRVSQEKTSFYRGAVIVTGIANLLFGIDITDEPTCYKLIERSLLLEMNLSEEKFAYCPEVTAKIAKLGYKVPELPISYYPRSIAEGKKIRWKDGFHAIWVLIKYKVLPVRSWRVSQTSL
tara:strand:- start:6345 stop:7070 length:726 start_codon:yes stop_codon:yes gene_type:complete